jgi:hypothetical protein
VGLLCRLEWPSIICYNMRCSFKFLSKIVNTLMNISISDDDMGKF